MISSQVKDIPDTDNIQLSFYEHDELCFSTPKDLIFTVIISKHEAKRLITLLGDFELDLKPGKVVCVPAPIFSARKTSTRLYRFWCWFWYNHDHESETMQVTTCGRCGATVLGLGP